MFHGKLDGEAVMFLLACPGFQATHMGLLALVGLKELVITEPRSEIVIDVEEFEEVCLKTHVIAVSLDSKFDRVVFHQVREQKFFHSVEIILPGIEAKDR